MLIKSSMFILMIICLTSCSINRKLVLKERTKYGVIKFFVENDLKNYNYQKRLLGIVDNLTCYSFYKDRLVKQAKSDKI